MTSDPDRLTDVAFGVQAVSKRLASGAGDAGNDKPPGDDLAIISGTERDSHEKTAALAPADRRGAPAPGSGVILHR